MVQRHVNERPGRLPSIEALEGRRLLSADLSIAFASVPDPWLAGQKTSVNVRITNVGDAQSSGRVAVNLYASNDARLDADDVLLATTTRSAKLKPGRSLNLKLRVLPPTSLVAGSYTLLAALSAGKATPTTGAAADVNPANDVAISPGSLAVSQPTADLAAQFVALPAWPIEIDGFSAGSAKAVVRVVNGGNATARGTVYVDFYLSADAVLDAQDPLVAAPPARAVTLKPGRGTLFSARIVPPPNTAAGGYFLFAVATAGGGIADVNPNNDAAISPERVAVVNQLPVQVIDEREQYYDEVYYVGPAYYETIDGGYFVTSDNYASDDVPAYAYDPDPSEEPNYVPDPGVDPSVPAQDPATQPTPPTTEPDPGPPATEPAPQDPAPVDPPPPDPDPAPELDPSPSPEPEPTTSDPAPSDPGL